MIPDFLRSLAALIRNRIAAGQAVHVTEQTAKEMELLAELPWDRAYPDLPLAAGWNRSPTAGDIALGWLLASKVVVDPENGAGLYIKPAEVVRAAVCAELCALAREKLVFDVCRESAVVLALMGKKELAQSILGTREGVRTAWAFIIEQLTPYDSARPDCAEHRAWAAERAVFLETHRRELEAMK